MPLFNPPTFTQSPAPKGRYPKGYEISINNDIPEFFIPANENRLQLDIQNTGLMPLNIYLVPSDFNENNPIPNTFKCVLLEPGGSYTTTCFVGKVAANSASYIEDAGFLAHEISSEVIP